MIYGKTNFFEQNIANKDMQYVSFSEASPSDTDLIILSAQSRDTPGYLYSVFYYKL